SALIKRYLFENGSKKVDTLFEECDEVYISEITEIEINSALKRRLVEKDIENSSYNYILNEFYEDLKDFNIIDLSFYLKKRSIELIRKNQLKTLDSLQLGAALLSPVDIFVTADKKLYNIARLEFNNKSLYIE
nr:type II toxin-antitoxin system VapC family toxin [Spirochaetota bacterium]